MFFKSNLDHTALAKPNCITLFDFRLLFWQFHLPPDLQVLQRVVCERGRSTRAWQTWFNFKTQIYCDIIKKIDCFTTTRKMFSFVKEFRLFESSKVKMDF